MTPISAPTLTRLMLDTTAMRSPAITTGMASGSSTRSRRRVGPKPIAVAAWRTGSGTERSPSTTLGTSTHSENRVSGISSVRLPSPV